MNVTSAYKFGIFGGQETQRTSAVADKVQPKVQSLLTSSGDTVSISPEAWTLSKSAAAQERPKSVRDVFQEYDLLREVDCYIEVNAELEKPVPLRDDYKELNYARMELLPAAYAMPPSKNPFWAKLTEVNDAFMKGDITQEEARRASAAITDSTPSILGTEIYLYEEALRNVWFEVCTDMGLYAAESGEELPHVGPDVIKAVKTEVIHRMQADAQIASYMQACGIQFSMENLLLV